MNDLTKEAGTDDFGGLGMNIKRDPAELGHSPFQLPEGLMEEMRREQIRGYRNANAGPKYGDKSLNPDRPLTVEWEHYLTGYEGSRCDRIDVPHETTHGFDIETYSDGYSEGVAAGMTLMEPNMEESRTGINLDKINRVSDEYRRISNEVENEAKETETWKNYPDGKKPF